MFRIPGRLIQSISLSPGEPASPEWEEDEPESISSPREVSKFKIKINNVQSIHHISLNRQISPLSHISRFSQTISDEE